MPEELQDLRTVLATLSSSLDETVVGASLALVQDDYKAHQELLQKMAQTLSLKVEEIEDSAPALVDINNPLDQQEFLITEAISKPIKAL